MSVLTLCSRYWSPIRSRIVMQRQMRWQTKSCIQGPSEPPLLEQTIPQHFASVVKSYGDRLAVISTCQNERLTYRRLDEKSNSLAHGLAGLGVVKGDRVAVCLGNSVEHAIAIYSIFKLGAVLVPLNPAFNTRQIASALNHVLAKTLIISTQSKPPYDKPSRSNVPLLEELGASKENAVPSLRHVVLVDNGGGIDGSVFDVLSSRIVVAFDALVQHYRSDAVMPSSPLHRHDTCNIQFTSGTTSAPKAACLTHHSILNNGYSVGQRLALAPSPESIVVCAPPLFHCFGSVIGYMATATHAATIAFPSESFSPRAVVDCLLRLSSVGMPATAVHGVPTMFLALLAHVETLSRQEFLCFRRAVSRLWTGVVAGAPVPESLTQALSDKFPALNGLCVCFGMTESSPVSTMTRADASTTLPRILDTVGTPLPHVCVKVVKPKTSAAHKDYKRKYDALPVNERGEVAVSGYLVMKEYWNDVQRTRDAVVEDTRRWLLTGDEGKVTATGELVVTGRLSDVIVRSGENVRPVEIEAVVRELDSVHDVAVVGVADVTHGEVPAAFVVATTSLSAREVKSHVRARLCGHFVPSYVWIVDKLPKTDTGKILKLQLRKDAAVRLDM